MKTPYVLSKKGWKLYSVGNALSMYSCLLIAFTLVAAALILVGVILHMNDLFPMVGAIVVIAFNVLAMVMIFVGRLLRWKGISLLLSAAQLTDTVVMQDPSIKI